MNDPPRGTIFIQHGYSRRIPSFIHGLALPLLFCFLPAIPAGAVTIYESASLGTTGLDQTGYILSNLQFLGVRFEITSTVETASVGGHFGMFNQTGGTFFGAIVALSDSTDFPDSLDLSTPDVLGATLLTFPALSDEVSANLSIALTPGWYALMFGSDQFGATGRGVAPFNNVDIGTPSYFFRDPSTAAFKEGGFDATRFFVNGVPEPTTLTLLGAAGFVACCRRRRKSFLQN